MLAIHRDVNLKMRREGECEANGPFWVQEKMGGLKKEVRKKEG